MKKTQRSFNSTLRRQSFKQRKANQQWTYLRLQAITEQSDIWGHNHCEWCGKPMFWANLEAHHMIERSKGGRDVYENLRLLGDVWECGCHDKFTRGEVR